MGEFRKCSFTTSNSYWNHIEIFYNFYKIFKYIIYIQFYLFRTITQSCLKIVVSYNLCSDIKVKGFSFKSSEISKYLDNNLVSSLFKSRVNIFSTAMIYDSRSKRWSIPRIRVSNTGFNTVIRICFFFLNMLIVYVSLCSFANDITFETRSISISIDNIFAIRFNIMFSPRVPRYRKKCEKKFSPSERVIISNIIIILRVFLKRKKNQKKKNSVSNSIFHGAWRRWSIWNRIQSSWNRGLFSSTPPAIASASIRPREKVTAVINDSSPL